MSAPAPRVRLEAGRRFDKRRAYEMSKLACIVRGWDVKEYQRPDGRAFYFVARPPKEQP